MLFIGHSSWCSFLVDLVVTMPLFENGVWFSFTTSYVGIQHSNCHHYHGTRFYYWLTWFEIGNLVTTHIIDFDFLFGLSCRFYGFVIIYDVSLDWASVERKSAISFSGFFTICRLLRLLMFDLPHVSTVGGRFLLFLGASALLLVLLSEMLFLRL